MSDRKEAFIDKLCKDYYVNVYQILKIMLYDPDDIKNCIQEVFFAAYKEYSSICYLKDYHKWLGSTAKGVAHEYRKNF